MGRWKIVRGSAPDEVMELLETGAEPPAESGVQILRRGNTRLTFLVPSQGIIKVLRRVGSRERVRSLFAPSTLAHEFDLTEAARRRTGVAPEPVFVAEQRTLGLLRQAAIMIRQVPNCTPLDALLEAAFPPPGHKPAAENNIRDILAELGNRLARLHMAGGIHSDPSPDNVLVGEDPTHAITLIDWASALFAGLPPRCGQIGRRMLVRATSERFGLSTNDVRSVFAGIESYGANERAFRRMRLDDTRKMIYNLIQCGVPAAEIIRCLQAYGTTLEQSREETARLIEDIADQLPRGIRRSIPRTLRNADRGSRATAARR